MLRHALMRDAQGRPSGPLGTALDLKADKPTLGPVGDSLDDLK